MVIISSGKVFKSPSNRGSTYQALEGWLGCGFSDFQVVGCDSSQMDQDV